MSRTEILRIFEESLEEPPAPGTLHGDERCDDVEGWTSLAILSFISAINKQQGITVPPARILACRTVDDVVDLVAGLTAS